MMRITWISMAALLAATALPAMSAQDLRAVTEDGRKVLLAPDGHWKFDNRSQSNALPPVLAPQSPYQTAVKKISVAFDTSKWTLTEKKDDEEPNKRYFKHKTLPIFSLVIGDEIPATTESVKNVIIYNAKAAGANTQVILDELVDVDGKKVGSIRFTGTFKGIDFLFSSRYYGDGDGNIQVTCYTGQAIYFKYQNECEQFISGLAIK